MLDDNTAKTIPLGNWTLAIGVKNEGTDKWPDYKTTLYLSHIHLKAADVLELAKQNKLFMTDTCTISNNSIFTKYDTVHDIRVDILPKDYNPLVGLSERIRTDMTYISKYCNYYQY